MTLAQRMHRKLIALLGAKCSAPGCYATERLEIDHPNGRRVSNRSQAHRRKSFAARVREYWLEFAADVPLRVLCRSHNARDGGARRCS